MYRCQLCNAIVPAGIPAQRLVLATRPAVYLDIRHEKQHRCTRLDDGVTSITVYINHEKQTIRREASLDELREGLGTAYGYYRVLDGTEILREVLACPECMFRRTAPPPGPALPDVVERRHRTVERRYVRR